MEEEIDINIDHVKSGVLEIIQPEFMQLNPTFWREI